MNRREFVKQVAMASAVIAGAKFIGYGCSEPAKNIRWSMGWILWRDFKNAEISFSEAVNNLHELGLDGIEYTPRPNDLTKYGFNTRENLRDFLAEKNISVTANYFRGDFYDPEKHGSIISSFYNTLENLKFYNAKNVILEPPGRGGWVDINHAATENIESVIPEKIKAMSPFLNQLGKIAAEEGMTIGIHPHLNTIVETPDEIDLLMDLTDPEFVKMVPDTGHLFLGGGNVAEIIKKYQDRICYLHLKDASGVFKRPNFGPNVRELGKGEIDFPEVMRILKEAQFTGWLNVEQDYTTMTPYESASESMKYINGSMKPVYS